MARSKPKPEPSADSHNGLPITARKIKVTRTGDGLSDAMTVVPVEVKDGAEYMISMRIRHTGTNYVLDFSKDDPDDPIGYTEIFQFAAQAAVFDDRPDAAEQVEAMEARLRQKAAEEAAEAERLKREARGEFRIVGLDRPEDD